MTALSTLLSPDFMRRLDRLDVVSRKVLAGKLKGERRSKKRGRSVEFADYRPYVSGDDLRFIDWNLYARLDRLFLRLFLEEEDLTLTVLLDVSRSMDWGDPNKLHYAKQIAAALGYVGLTHQNRVTLLTFSGTIKSRLADLRGRRPTPRMLAFLDEITAEGDASTDRVTPTGAGDLAQALRRFAFTHRSPGVVVVISDFLEKGDLADALRYLTSDRLDVYALHLLAPDEIDPTLSGLAGDLALADVEDGTRAEVSISPAVLKQYRTNLAAWQDEVRHACLRRGVAYLFSDTSRPFDDLVLQYLRERGLLG